MENTHIEWADHSCNFLIGCNKVSEECDFCYADEIEYHYGRDFTEFWGTDWYKIFMDLKKWDGSRIFANSMTDMFHVKVPDFMIQSMFKVMKHFPKHQFLILTKRPDRMMKYSQKNKIPDNVWLGTSIESEKHYMRAVILRGIKAKVHFISFEPLLSNVSRVDLTDIQWIIVGGESGSNARAMHEADVDAIFSQAQAKGIPFFFKQWGKGLSKCKCHNAFGCRLYKGKIWDEVPMMEIKA